MAKFLFRSTYTVDGMKGLSKDGGTKRADVVRKMVENAGGTMESLHFGFGSDDTYVLCDLPDHKTAAGLAIDIRAAGGLDTRVTPVLTPDEVDDAVQERFTYTPPGI